MPDNHRQLARPGFASGSRANAAAFNLDQLGAWETTHPAVLQTLQQIEQQGWRVRAPTRPQ